MQRASRAGVEHLLPKHPRGSAVLYEWQAKRKWTSYVLLAQHNDGLYTRHMAEERKKPKPQPAQQPPSPKPFRPDREQKNLAPDKTKRR